MNKNNLTIIFVILGSFVGIFASIYFGFASIVQHILSFDAVVLVVSIFLSYVVIVNIHELGHLFLGKLVGYKMLKYKFGSFTWKNENGKCKFVTEKSRGYDGLCLMIPPKESISKYKNLIYYLGGIITNLLTSGLIVIVFFMNPSLHLYIKEFLFVLMAL